MCSCDLSKFQICQFHAKLLYEKLQVAEKWFMDNEQRFADANIKGYGAAWRAIQDVSPWFEPNGR